MKSFSVVVKKKINKFDKTIFVEGDKSLSHRALLISSQGYGISKLRGLLESEDILNTINALKKLGVKIIKYKNIYHVYGNGLGSFKTKNNLTINTGNSGTLARLLMGLLTTYPHKIKIIGDKSLSKRPMERIITPLGKFGATFMPKNKKTLPCYMIGSEMPIAISHKEKIGSAQVKSSIILASLNTPGITKIKELKKSRDHTENMLKFIRAKIKIKKFKTYNLISIEGQKDFKAFNLNIPGDMSSAAFFIVLTLLTKHSIIKIKNINLNPTRTGIIIILKKMNAKIKLMNVKTKYGEIVGDIVVKSSILKSINCPASLVPSTIDEFAVLMIAAAKAKGTTTFSGLGELNKKESPRLNLMNSILNQVGIKTKLKRETIKIIGNPKINLNKSYIINSHFDHRICMSVFVMCQIFGGQIKIKDFNSVATSFPSFLYLMKLLGAKYEIKK